MKITIIGGSGFIGTDLIQGLTDNTDHEICNIDKRQSKENPGLTRVADVREKDQLDEAFTGSDWCVLLAAEHRDDVTPVSLYYDVNVEGTRNVLNAMDKNNIRKIIFTSSVAVYGLNKPNPNEQSPPAPFNHYGKSKWQAEQVLREWYHADQANRTLVIIRPTVVFGPANRGNVYNLLKQIVQGKFLKVGRGDNKKSMAYVKNITGFIRYCIENMQGYHIFNYTDKPDLDMNSLINIAERSVGKKILPVKIPYFLGYAGGLCFDIMAKITGRKYTISSVRIRKFCATTQYSNDMVVKSGYIPVYTLEQGLGNTIEDIMVKD